MVLAVRQNYVTTYKLQPMRRVPTLETDRLIIRELAMTDLVEINHVLNAAWGSSTPEREREVDVQQIRERESWLRWTVLSYEFFEKLGQPQYGERAVELRNSGEMIGSVGIVPYLDRFNTVAAFGRPSDAGATAEVGLYWAFAPAHHGKGYATEAAKAVMTYLFEHENLGRVIATTSYDNSASVRVMEKLGMKVERLKVAQPPDQFVVAVRENKV